MQALKKGKVIIMKNKKRGYQSLLIAAIPLVIVAFMFISNRTVSSQGGSGATTKVDAVSQKALDYYFEKVGDTVDSDDVEVKRKNYGCHFEIHIFNKGELSMRLSYVGGRFYEI